LKGYNSHLKSLSTGQFLSFMLLFIIKFYFQFLKIAKSPLKSGHSWLNQETGAKPASAGAAGNMHMLLEWRHKMHTMSGMEILDNRQ